jgi:hypothetical protein
MIYFYPRRLNMTNKEKITKAEKYIALINEKLSYPIPDKHIDHPKEYKQFLERELAGAKLKLERLKAQ